MSRVDISFSDWACARSWNRVPVFTRENRGYHRANTLHRASSEYHMELPWIMNELWSIQRWFSVVPVFATQEAIQHQRNSFFVPGSLRSSRWRKKKSYTFPHFLSVHLWVVPQDSQTNTGEIDDWVHRGFGFFHPEVSSNTQIHHEEKVVTRHRASQKSIPLPHVSEGLRNESRFMSDEWRSALLSDTLFVLFR